MAIFSLLQVNRDMISRNDGLLADNTNLLRLSLFPHRRTPFFQVVDTLRVQEPSCPLPQLVQRLSAGDQLEVLHQSIEDHVATARELIKVACVILEHAQLARQLLDAHASFFRSRADSLAEPRLDPPLTRQTRTRFDSSLSFDRIR